jgi:hypothetical protein
MTPFTTHSSLATATTSLLALLLDLIHTSIDRIPQQAILRAKSPVVVALEIECTTSSSSDGVDTHLLVLVGVDSVNGNTIQGKETSDFVLLDRAHAEVLGGLAQKGGE